MTIPITYIRSSSFGCHDMCEMKYFAEYVLGWVGKSNLAADKGTIFHKVMELLAHAKKADQEDRKVFHDDETDIDVSLKSDVDFIIDHVFGYYSQANDHHNWTEKEYKEIVKWCHKSLEFNNGQYDPRTLDIVDVEAHFDFEVPHKWAEYNYELYGKELTGRLRLKGTIDLVVKLDDNVYEIIDWKTGQRKNWATGEEKDHVSLRRDFQLRLYHYACHVLYPDIEDILATINYIRFGGPFTVNFERSEINETLDMIRKKFEYIQTTERPTVLPDVRPKDTWKCRRFCFLGMSTFEDTNVQPIIEKRYGQVTPYGKPMTKCEELRYVLNKRSIDKVIDNMSKSGHSVRDYRAPGSTDG